MQVAAPVTTQPVSNQAVTKPFSIDVTNQEDLLPPGSRIRSSVDMAHERVREIADEHRVALSKWDVSRMLLESYPTQTPVSGAFTGESSGVDQAIAAVRELDELVL